MAQITEDYVSFETAKLLKEKGFDGFCHRYYRCDKEDIDGNGKMFMFASDLNGFCYVTNSLLNYYGDEHEENILAPTLQMAMKWLREVHNLFIEIYGDTADIYYDASIYGLNNERKKKVKDFSSYEEACEAGIKYCLENLI